MIQDKRILSSQLFVDLLAAKYLRSFPIISLPDDSNVRLVDLLKMHEPLL